MKLKGVNPFEQHIEKIVLAVVGGIFLIVLAAQFLLNPNQVRVGNVTVPPARAYEQVQSRAELVRAQIRRGEGEIELPEVPAVDLAEQFLAQRVAPLTERASRVAWGPSLQLDITPGVTASIETERIAQLEIPRPTEPVGYSPRGTLDPFEIAAVPELKQFVQSEQPYDFAAISVETRFNGRELRSALLTSNEEGAQPIPAAWWREGVEIVLVRVEREEQTATGEWTNLTEIEVLPGRRSMADSLRQVRNTTELADVVHEAAHYAQDIRRPRFPRMIAGMPWVEPAKGAERQPQVRSEAIDTLLREHAQLVRQLDEAKAERAELEGDREAGRTGGRVGGGGGDQRDADRRRAELDRRIQGLERRRAGIRRQLRDRGVDPPEDEEKTELDEQQREQRRALLEETSVQLWAHDLSVQPGKVYRYRFSVGINNPAFGRASVLIEEQQDMAALAVLMSPPSEWSQPVQVLDDEYYFIYSAHPADSLGGARTPPRARAEVFKFFYGYYRPATVQLEPGDVVAAQVRLPDSDRLLIFDVAALDRRNGEADRGGVGQMVEQEQREEVGVPWEGTVTAMMETYLLDVATVPGATGTGGQQQALAYLRSDNGTVVMRNPDEDRRSRTYHWVRQSAQEGETQGVPEVEPDPDPDPDPGPRPIRRQEEDPPPDIGGGGASGG